MVLVLELPRWRMVRHANDNVMCYIPPMSKDPIDHYWFTVEIFKMREAWKNKDLPNTDNWALHYYYNDSDFAYFKYFEHRRDALRALGVWCRNYMKLAQARYGGLLDGSLGKN